VAGLIQKFKMNTLTKMDISKVSLNNQYQVHISGMNPELKGYLGGYYDVPKNYADGSNIGIMCSEATLPTSSFATSEVKDNFHGINQQFAHTRIYIDSDFTFYVDRNYNTLKFFEGWMDYISGDNNPISGITKETDTGYFKRFNYPMNESSDAPTVGGKSGYKCGVLTISKFERSFFRRKNEDEVGDKSLEYTFINAFPKGMTSIPVQYGGADLTKVTVQFAYDRYVLKSRTSIN